MAIIIARVTNNLNYMFTMPGPSFIGQESSNLAIPANAVDLDLLTLTTDDGLWAIQPQLEALVRTGQFTVTGYIDTASFDYDGVSTIRADNNPAVRGNIHLLSGTNITLAQAGTDITINATGGGGGVSSVNGLTGAVTLAPGANVSITPSGNTLTIASTGGSGSPAGIDGELQFNNAGAFGADSNLTYVGGILTLGLGIKTPAIQITTAPTAGFVLTSDATGHGTWQASSGGGSPAGSDTWIQYNDAGVFGADGNFNWNKTSQLLSITGTPGSGPGFRGEAISLNTGDMYITNGNLWFFGGPGDGNIKMENGGNILLSGTSGLDNASYMTFNGTINSIVFGGTFFRVDNAGNISNSASLRQQAIGAPALSAAAEGSIYFDSILNKFMASENGGAYVPLVGGSGGSASAVVASVSLAGQIANIGVTTLFTPTVKGTYRISAYTVYTAGDGTDGIATFNTFWTDDTNVTQSGSSLFNAGGINGWGSGVIGGGNSSAGPASGVTFSSTFEAIAGQPISYAVSGGTYASSVYSIYVVLEQLVPVVSGGTSGGAEIVAKIALTGQNTDQPGGAQDTTANVPFIVVKVVDGTHLTVFNNTNTIAPGDTVVQGVNTTTVTTVTDQSHIIVADTTGWITTPNLFIPTVSGLYQLNAFSVGTGTVPAPTNPTLQFFYTDDSGLQLYNAVYDSFVSATSPNTLSFTNSIELVAGQPIQYAVTGGSYDPSSSYSLYMSLVELTAVGGGSGGSPSGPNLSVQFDNAGAFGSTAEVSILPAQSGGKTMLIGVDPTTSVPGNPMTWLTFIETNLGQSSSAIVATDLQIYSSARPNDLGSTGVAQLGLNYWSGGSGVTAATLTAYSPADWGGTQMTQLRSPNIFLCPASGNVPNAGSVLIGDSAGQRVGDQTAILDIQSTEQGFLPPRMTTAQRNIITVAANGITYVENFAPLAGATFTINGVVLTEGVDWTASTDNLTTATSLSAAITAATATTLCTAVAGSIAGFGSVTITANTPGPAGNSITTVSSDNVNLVPSGPTLAQGKLPAPALVIYNTDSNQPQYYNGTAWVAMTGGGSSNSVVTVTTNTIAGADNIIQVDATSGALIITLPVASSSLNAEYTIKKIDASANAVTIQGNGADTIDGSNTQLLNVQWASRTVVCNGASWILI